jgi:hypothetical protein
VRAVVAGGQTRHASGVEWQSVRVAGVPLAGGPVTTQVLGSPLRDANSLAPLLLADGRPAIVWGDNRGFLGAGGRLHLAIEGAAAVPPRPAPRVRIGRPLRTVIGKDEPLRLPVRCSAACDVRLHLAADSGLDEQISLAHAGVRTARLGSGNAPVAPKRRGPVRVRVLYGAPGAAHPGTRLLTFRLRRAPEPARPKLTSASAVRDSQGILVTWTTDIPAKGSDFTVTGAATRSVTARPLDFGAGSGTGTRFSVRLQRTKDIRFVTVQFTRDLDDAGPRKVVRVR